MVRLLLIVAVLGCSSAIANAGMLTDTQNQVGTLIQGGPGRLVHLATFSIPSQSSEVFTEMRLRLWIEQSQASPPPQLLFAQSGSNPLDLFSGPPVPLQNIGNGSLTGNYIYEYVSPLITLSLFDSQRISSLISSSSGGNLDAYLYSPTSSDFSIPQSSTTWTFTRSAGFSTITNAYTSTLTLVAVPEPMTAIAFGLGLVTLCLVRKRLRRKKNK